MLQTIIVYVIVLLSIGGTVFYLLRKLRVFRKNPPSDGCSTCPLKENCLKMQQSHRDCCCAAEK